MKIKMIESGHWEVAPRNYPNKIVKTKPKKRGLSFYTHPEDRDNFFQGAFLEDLLPSEVASDNNEIERQSRLDSKKADEQERLAKKRVLDPGIKRIQDEIKQLGTDLKDKQESEAKNAADVKGMHRNIDTLSNELSNLFKIMK